MHTRRGGVLGADGDEVGVRCAAPRRPRSPRRGPPHPDPPWTARGHMWVCPSEAEEQAGTCLPTCASGPLRVGCRAEAPSVPGSQPPGVESTRPSRREVLLRPWGLSRSERHPRAAPPGARASPALFRSLPVTATCASHSFQTIPAYGNMVKIQLRSFVFQQRQLHFSCF